MPTLNFSKTKTVRTPTVAYELRYNSGKKTFSKRTKLPKYKAIKELIQTKGTNKRIIRTGYTSQKDIKAFKLTKNRLEKSGNSYYIKPLKRKV